MATLAEYSHADIGPTASHGKHPAIARKQNEWTRERVPLDWAMTQNNLGTALSTLGQRESGTERLGPMHKS
jgi:hypothetical protein